MKRCFDARAIHLVFLTSSLDCCNSYISTGQELLVYGVGNHRKMDSTIFSGSNPNMVFGDDTTLENVYKDHNDLGRITVIAPAGKLGIVIENPRGDIPIVYAIKETSVLNGRVKVGDLLLSVDEYDCRGMPAVAVSQLISSRAENPKRTLVLLRSS